MLITRTCKGVPVVVLFLNKAEFKAMDRLLDVYLVTETHDPDLNRLRKIKGEMSGKKNI